MAVLLSLESISKRYGAVTILEDVTVSLSEGQKIGMIGRNGAGKSTLCKMITGEEEMDRGEVHRNAALRLAYLEQHDSFGPEETVIDFLMRRTQKQEWECAEIAAKFHLKGDLLDRPISSLPGGYRTRVKLAMMLLQDPNFLLLDEPTNYLDLSTLILLENFLRDFFGGFLIVSHDREFLKRTCDHTLEVEQGTATLYPGDIEEYFEFKEEQRAQKLAYNRTVEKKKAQLQEFVDRFRAKASTATRAKSKMKQIEKLKTIEIQHDLHTVNIRIPTVEYKTGLALSCDQLEIGYSDRQVASGITLEVDRGKKVAILGDNGQGKTTFLRTLSGDIKARNGSFKWGTGLKIAYYAQHVFSSLHPDDDVFSHLSRMAVSGINQQDVLDMAGAFLFKGDDVRKKVAVLSGGERARLLLAGLLLTRSQVLLLDEPTNHLDFETVEALGHALKKFSGTIFFVCHDRTFVNLIANHVLEVKDGQILKYPGTYEDYVYHLEMEAREDGYGMKKKMTSESKKSNRPLSHQSDSSQEEASEGKQASCEDAKKIRQELKKLQAHAVKTESRIQHLTKEKETLFEELAKNPFNYSRERDEKIRSVTISLENSEAEWMDLLEKIEKLQAKLSKYSF